MAKTWEDNTDWDNWEYDPNDNGDTSPQPSPLEEREQEEQIVVKDTNGVILQEGDTVAAIKDLKVKGAKDIKRGDKFGKIRLTDDEGLIESGKMVLKTEFFKKI